MPSSVAPQQSPERDTDVSTQTGQPTVTVHETDHAGQARADTAATFAATLVDEWVELGLTNAIVCPGSRSTPMALAFHNDDRVDVQVHIDERSAAFMALGAAITTRRPVAVLSTSGTAAVEFHPAVIEADLANVPMIVVTADRPPELRGVGAPQTIDQRNLYGTAPRWFKDAEVPRSSDRDMWRQIARDAWTNATGERPGPVHLNLAFREPLIGTPGALPRPAASQQPTLLDQDTSSITLATQRGLSEADLENLTRMMAGRRGVIIAGARAANSRVDAAGVHLLAEHLGWPVLADGPSGCRIEVLGSITAFDSLLRSEDFTETHQPEVVLRIGGLLTSKVLNRWVAGSDAVRIGFDQNGPFADPDGVFPHQWVVSTARACEQLRAALPQQDDASWRQSWIDAEDLSCRTIDKILAKHSEVTEPAVIVDLFALLNDGGTVVLSSSMPVRDAEWFAPGRNGVKVVSNRGASGIDGVTSTAVGAALSGEPTALVIGDLAFLHDSNALIGLEDRQVNLLIVVFDNDGGGIFSMLPVRDQVDHPTFEKLFGAPHGLDLVKVAEAYGVPAERVSSRTGAQAAMVGALSRGGPRVVVVGTDRGANRRLHGEINEAVFDALAAAGQR